MRGNARVFTAQAVTGSNTYTSPITSIRYAQRGAYVLSWTGTPAGTFSVEVSSDPDTTLDANASWTPLTLSGSGAPAGSASSTYIHMVDLAFGRMRLKYTNTSGTGTLTADVGIKG